MRLEQLSGSVRPLEPTLSRFWFGANPRSSRACAPMASWAMSWSATCSASEGPRRWRS
jgi:hypothetical protein